MKTTKNVNRYYAMNLYDGRIAIVTRELLTNPDYRIITERLAREIESGNQNWKDIAFQLRQRDSMNPNKLLKLAEQEKVKNLRPSSVTRENVEQFETKIDKGEIGEAFDGDGGSPSKQAAAAGETSPADDGGGASEEAQTPPEAPLKKYRKTSKQAAAAGETSPADDGVTL